MEGSNLSKSLVDPNLHFSTRLPPNEVEQLNEWTSEENQLFENALTEVDGLNSSELFEKIAAKTPGKTVEEVEKHYEALVDDVEMIEEGKIPLPEYNPIKAEVARRNVKTGKKKKEVKTRRRWTEEEHKLFITGYEKHGRAWRTISDEYVKNKTPTQVAIHARRYLERQNKRHQDAANSIKPSADSSSSGAKPPSNNVTEKPSQEIPENQSSNSHFSGQLLRSCNNINIRNAENEEDEEDFLDLDKFPSIYDY